MPPIGHRSTLILSRSEIGDLILKIELLWRIRALHGHQGRMRSRTIKVGGSVLGLSLGSCLPEQGSLAGICLDQLVLVKAFLANHLVVIFSVFLLQW